MKVASVIARDRLSHRPIVIASIALAIALLIWGRRVDEVGDDYFLAARAGTQMTDTLDVVSLGDGHLYRVLAQDPLLRRDDVMRVRSESAYRSQRMLVPWLLWLSTFGHDAGLELAQFFWLLAGIAIGSWAMADALRRLGAPPHAGVLVAVIPGMIATLHFAGIDTVAGAAVALAMRAHCLSRRRERTIWLTASVLARESSIVVAVAILLEQCWNERSLRPMVGVSGIPLLVLALWQLVLHQRFGQWAITGGLDANRGLAWSGLASGVEIWRWRSIASALVIAIALAIPFIARGPLWTRLLSVVSLAASSSFGVAVWGSYLGFPRPFIPTCLAAILVAAQYGRVRGTSEFVGGARFADT
jgi:hypothetical protein